MFLVVKVLSLDFLYTDRVLMKTEKQKENKRGFKEKKIKEIGWILKREKK